MRMLCYKCNHSWNYKGKNTEGEGYITCPGCYYKIRVDKALIESPFKQKLLTNLPITNKLPTKLPTTQPKIEFEIIKDKDNFVYRVDKKMSKQFKEILDEEEDEVEDVQEQESVIRILPPKFEIIRVIPRDPIKILEHQRSFF